jgi:hypothetical protein
MFVYSITVAKEFYSAKRASGMETRYKVARVSLLLSTTVLVLAVTVQLQVRVLYNIVSFGNDKHAGSYYL